MTTQRYFKNVMSKDFTKWAQIGRSCPTIFRKLLKGFVGNLKGECNIRAGLDVMTKIIILSCQESNPGRSALSLVTVLTEISRLLIIMWVNYVVTSRHYLPNSPTRYELEAPLNSPQYVLFFMTTDAMWAETGKLVWAMWARMQVILTGQMRGFIIHSMFRHPDISFIQRGHKPACRQRRRDVPQLASMNKTEKAYPLLTPIFHRLYLRHTMYKSSLH
jgi:hypothetical protein